jgi:hypothetical protein
MKIGDHLINTYHTFYAKDELEANTIAGKIEKETPAFRKRISLEEKPTGLTIGLQTAIDGIRRY